MRNLHFIITLSIIFSLSANAQKNEDSEDEMRNKAELYFKIFDDLDLTTLPEEDKTYLKENPNVGIDFYYQSKANFYFTELINKFPKSKYYISYLYKKGYSAIGYLDSDKTKSLEAKECFLKVIDINKSAYYKKMSFYNLAWLYSNEGDCISTHKYIEEFYTVESTRLNEYEEDYTESNIQRMNKICPK